MPYIHREYPKWVTPHGGKPIIVHSYAEEAEVLGLNQAKPEAPVEAELNQLTPMAPPSVTTEVLPTGETLDEKDALIAEARALGIKANKLWGIPKLKASLAQHKAS